MRRLATLSVLLSILSGCNGMPTVPTEAKVIVSIPCIDKMPEKPSFITDAELLKLDAFHFIIALRQDQLNARGYIATSDALMLACVE